MVIDSEQKAIAMQTCTTYTIICQPKVQNPIFIPIQIFSHLPHFFIVQCLSIHRKTTVKPKSQRIAKKAKETCLSTIVLAHCNISPCIQTCTQSLINKLPLMTKKTFLTQEQRTTCIYEINTYTLSQLVQVRNHVFLNTTNQVLIDFGHFRLI